MFTLTKFWWIALLKSIVLILLAIFTFTHPVNALIGLGIYISFSLLITGIFQTVLAILSKNNLPNWGWTLAVGLIDILFAFILFSNPAVTAATLPFVVGFWVIFYGVTTLANSIEDKKKGNGTWWLGLLGGILAVVIGYNIMNNLLAGTIVITSWMGLGFFIAGLVNMVLAFGLKSLNN